MVTTKHHTMISTANPCKSALYDGEIVNAIEQEEIIFVFLYCQMYNCVVKYIQILIR